MKKIISVYELLGLIKDDKAPKMIKYKGNNYMFTGYDYHCILTDIEKGFVEYWLIGNYNKDLNCLLNEKVKILEEDKPIIEKIKMNGESFYSEYINSWIKKENSDAYCEYLSNKLNEVIEFLNRKEDK